MIHAGDECSTAPSALWPIEFPAVVGGLAVVAVAGDLGVLAEFGAEATFNSLSRNDSVRAAVVRIDSTRSTIDPWYFAEPVSRLSAVKPTFAFIERAIGGAYLLAACCRAIIAAPQSAVGAMGYRPDGDVTPELAEQLEAFDAQQTKTLCGLRSKISSRIARRLLDDEIRSGELLEHFGIADMIMPWDRVLHILGEPK